ncbi:hypothetical protein PS273GM_12245 [Stutzerimonas stutzeri]|uniref:Uncharacterized protein n=1 Tax=Stutzerimonas stutzeri TaxID=316 RepID=A0A172WRF6_STUST|nr:hypothetical protein PS273GM_12245 [Stutzerimonas stutzeri]
MGSPFNRARIRAMVHLDHGGEKSVNWQGPSLAHRGSLGIRTAHPFHATGTWPPDRRHSASLDIRLFMSGLKKIRRVGNAKLTHRFHSGRVPRTPAQTSVENASQFSTLLILRLAS